MALTEEFKQRKTLRDDLAIAVLNRVDFKDKYGNPKRPSEIAKEVYDMADSIIYHRNKNL